MSKGEISKNAEDLVESISSTKTFSALGVALIFTLSASAFILREPATRVWQLLAG